MVKRTPKRRAKHLGRVTSAHRRGTCRWCNTLQQTPKGKKSLGNCAHRTRPKDRPIPEE